MGTSFESLDPPRGELRKAPRPQVNYRGGVASAGRVSSLTTRPIPRDSEYPSAAIAPDLVVTVRSRELDHDMTKRLEIQARELGAATISGTRTAVGTVNVDGHS